MSTCSPPPPKALPVFVYVMLPHEGWGRQTSNFIGEMSLACYYRRRYCAPSPHHTDNPNIYVSLPRTSVCTSFESLSAEPLGITIAAEGFTQTGDTPFGPLERFDIPELREGLHAFGICAHVEVGFCGDDALMCLSTRVQPFDGVLYIWHAVLHAFDIALE